MLKTIAAFKDVVASLSIELFEREGKRSRLKARITFIDGSVLVIKDYYFGDERKYAYHWMDEKGKLYIRWDNSPHWPEVSTYPHHKHIGSPDNVELSLEIELRDVLKVIRSRIIVQRL